jgi:hypothetical protein
MRRPIGQAEQCVSSNAWNGIREFQCFKPILSSLRTKDKQELIKTLLDTPLNADGFASQSSSTSAWLDKIAAEQIQAAEPA